MNLGTHYDFGVADFKLAGQYFAGANAVGNVTGLLELGDQFTTVYDDLSGFALVTGADIPAWGGEWTVSVAYTDGESDDADAPKMDLKGYSAGVMYAYPLSKQTVIKAGVGYIKTEADVEGYQNKAEYENYNAVIGLLKYF